MKKKLNGTVIHEIGHLLMCVFYLAKLSNNENDFCLNFTTHIQKICLEEDDKRDGHIEISKSLGTSGKPYSSYIIFGGIVLESVIKKINIIKELSKEGLIDYITELGGAGDYEIYKNTVSYKRPNKEASRFIKRLYKFQKYIVEDEEIEEIILKIHQDLKKKGSIEGEELLKTFKPSYNTFKLYGEHFYRNSHEEIMVL